MLLVSSTVDRFIALPSPRSVLFRQVRFVAKALAEFKFVKVTCEVCVCCQMVVVFLRASGACGVQHARTAERNGRYPYCVKEQD